MIDLDKAKFEFSHAGNERAILACVLKDVSLYYEVESRLNEADFLIPENRAIWTIIRSLVRQEVVLDTTAVLTQAESLGLTDKIYGYDYVSALFDKAVDTENLDFYVSRVIDAGTKLRVLHILNEVESLVEKNKSLAPDLLPAESIVDLAQSRFMEVALSSQRIADAVDFADGIEEFVEDLTADKSGFMGLSTSFTRLDEALNSLEPGTLTVIGARPKVGKSALLLNWASHIAYSLKKPVLYLDTEMSTREQRLRLLSLLSGVPERVIKRGEFKRDPYQSKCVAEAVEIVKSGFIAHKYFPDFSAESIAAIARKYYHQEQIGCLLFDYIKLSDDDLGRLKNGREDQFLGYLSSALKKVAGELDIPVVTAAQIGRRGADKGRVSSADFADSDRILRYANTLLGLSVKTKEDLTKAEEMFGRDVAMRMGTHRLQILAARSGGEDFGGIDIYFRRDILTMREADQQISDHLKNEQEVSV